MIAVAFPVLFFLTASLTLVDETSLMRHVLSHKGKVVVVNMWATWCSPCRKEMPALIAFEKKHAAAGVKLLLVSADEPEDEAKARQFLDNVRAPIPRYLKQAVDDQRFINSIDPEWSGALPATFVYDRSGKRFRSFSGEIDIRELAAAVEGL